MSILVLDIKNPQCLRDSFQTFVIKKCSFISNFKTNFTNFIKEKTVLCEQVCTFIS